MKVYASCSLKDRLLRKNSLFILMIFYLRVRLLIYSKLKTLMELSIKLEDLARVKAWVIHLRLV